MGYRSDSVEYRTTAPRFGTDFTRSASGCLQAARSRYWSHALACMRLPFWEACKLTPSQVSAKACPPQKTLASSRPPSPKVAQKQRYLEVQASCNQATTVHITPKQAGQLYLRDLYVVYNYSLGLAIITLDLHEYIPYTIYHMFYTIKYIPYSISDFCEPKQKVE